VYELPPRDLNPNIYPSHPTSTYTYGVTTAPTIRGGKHLLPFVSIGEVTSNFSFLLLATT